MKSMVSSGDFRDMSTLNPETVIQGKAYLMWIKDSKEYSDPDYYYGVAFKGNSRFGHSDFSYVCMKRNKKVFFSKCINEGQEDPTWQECMEAMDMGKAPVGHPKLLTDRAYTFAEVAMIAYQEKYFTDQEGLQVVSKKTAPPKAALAATKSGPSDTNVDPKEIIRAAKEASDELDRTKNTGSTEHPFSPGLIPNNNLSNIIVNNISEEDVGIKDNENNDDMDLEDWKERAIMAESRLTNTVRERDLLEGKVAELKAKLESSLEQQNRFMSAADNATMTIESMNDDMAIKVIKKVEPKLSKIETLDKNLGTVLAKLGDLGAVVANIPLLMDKLQDVSNKVDNVGSRMESSCESLSEGVHTVEKTLSTFGIDEGEFVIDIPANIKTVVDKLSGGNYTNHTDNSTPGGAQDHALTHRGGNGGTTRQNVVPVQTHESQAPAIQAPALQSPALQNPVLQNPVLQNPVVQNPVIQSHVLQAPPVLPAPVQQHAQGRNLIPQYFSVTPPATPGLGLPGPNQYFAYQHYNLTGQVHGPKDHLCQQTHEYYQGQGQRHGQGQVQAQGQGQDQRHGHGQVQVQGQGQSQRHGQGQLHVQGQGQSQEQVQLTRKQRRLQRAQEYQDRIASKRLKVNEGEIYNQPSAGGQRGGYPSNQPALPSGSRQGREAPSLPNWGSGMLQDPPNVWQNQYRQTKPF